MKVRILKHSDIAACPCVSLLPDHYWEDGVCKCVRDTATPTTTQTWHDANGFPHDLPEPVPFTLEESDSWECTACETDVNADVDNAGHRYDGPTAVQVWTACPISGDGDGDVFTGSFTDALRYFTEQFAT